jgi:hypothetical protein
MSKQYTFQHTCGHIGIGPLIRCPSTPSSTDATGRPSPPTGPALQSIQLSLSLPCPFCANTQAYQNVVTGAGLLAILERFVSIPNNDPFPYEWRILRVCTADEISTSDWYLAHGPEGRYRQMAWIPKPCGRLQVGALEEERWNGDMVRGRTRKVDCSWRQRWREGDAVRSRLPGMSSMLSKSLLEDRLEEEMERLSL